MPQDSPLWGAPFVGCVEGDRRGPGCPDRSVLFLCSPPGLSPADCHLGMSTEKSYNKLNIVPLFSLQTLVCLAYRYFKYFCPQHIHDVENKESLLMHLLVFCVGYYNLHLSWEFKNSFHIQILDFEKSKALISY